VPAARFRVRQYIPRLRESGIEVAEMISRFGCYPPRDAWRRPFWGGAMLAAQIPSVIMSHAYDVVMLQREMMSTRVTLEPFLKRPLVLDIDDAIYLHRHGKPARRLAELSDMIVCGNDYLAEWFGQWNKNVTVIPTAVDSERFTPRVEHGQRDKATVIGWIGTSSNLKYLTSIESAIAQVMGQWPRTRLSVVCDRAPRFRAIPPERLEFHHWSEQTEVSLIQAMDIGLMPMEDTLWARGKCAFKMLQYMSCGLPVVVSPVGMNAEVLSMGDVGFRATTASDWVEGLTLLLENQELATKMGLEGRHLVERSFSVKAIAPRLADSLKAVSKAGQK